MIYIPHVKQLLFENYLIKAEFSLFPFNVYADKFILIICPFELRSFESTDFMEKIIDEIFLINFIYFNNFIIFHFFLILECFLLR